jgi:HEAT repeat protein
MAMVWLLISISSVALADTATQRNVRNLQSRLPAVRQQAAKTLGQSGDVAAVPALIEALSDPDNAVRREAAKALGFLKDRRTVKPLIAALRDVDTNVRMYSAYALGELRDSAATGQLLETLQDPQWCVRDQAAWALAEINDPSIVPTLVAALQDDSIEVDLLTRILRHLEDAETSHRLVELLDRADGPARLRIMEVLCELSLPQVSQTMIDLLEDDSPKIRLRAIQAIADHWDERAKKPLTALVAREANVDVRTSAEQLLFEHSRQKHLAAHWSFDDGNVETAVDVSGHGNDGVIQGCVSTEGKVGRALRFDQGKYIEFGQPAGLPIANRALTFLAWIHSEASNGVVIARGGAFCGYSLYLKDGVAKFGIHRVQDGPGFIVAGEENLVDRWVHLAGVIKQESLELYVDGELVATTKTAGYIPGNCGQGMEIGFDTGNSPAEITDHFVGLIDEVRIYNMALSGEEIAEEFRGAN